MQRFSFSYFIKESTVNDRKILTNLHSLPPEYEKETFGVPPLCTLCTDMRLDEFYPYSTSKSLSITIVSGEYERSSFIQVGHSDNPSNKMAIDTK
jgi:hypothetical protein